MLGNTSCSTEVTRSYGVTLETGSLRLNEFINPAEWRLIKLLWKLKYETLENLKFNERNFVERVDIVSAVTGIADPSGQRPAVVGWAADYVINVVMTFSNEDITQ